MLNPTFHHPGQPNMQAQVILASKGPNQDPIYTIRLRYPRIIHGEVMTHRVFSRNAGSSRARPAKVTIQEVRDTPFIPWHWGKNQSGMQASEECNSLVRPSHWFGKGGLTRKEAWLHARDEAIDIAQGFAEAGYHKQVFNRLLEPFSWIDVLATSTDWDNFLWLRDHEDAEPHIADLARLVKQAIDSCNIQDLLPGEWHLPYISNNDCEEAFNRFYLADDTEGWDNWLCRISAARCARISYAPFGAKEPDIQADLALYDKLVDNARIHSSPMEHQATPDTRNRLICDYAGEMDYGDPKSVWDSPELHGNLTGYIQFRKTIPGERWVEGMS